MLMSTNVNKDSKIDVAFFLFFTVPVIEIALFIKVGSAIGLIPTVFVILITALAGTFFVKQQASQLFDLFKRKAGNLRAHLNPLGMVFWCFLLALYCLHRVFLQTFFGFLLLIQVFDIGCLGKSKKICSY